MMVKLMRFSNTQEQRYSRHILLPEVGGRGQEKLLRARILVIGAGGLGSPVAFYLAAAGVGTIGLIDGDVVDLSNLHRQILHHTPDVDRPKVTSAQAKLTALNPDVTVIPHHERLTTVNALQLFAQYDLVIDGTDNFPTKFLANDAAIFTKRPLIHGGILRFVGQVMTILPGQTACYRCIFKEPPPEGLVPTCQEAGVLGALAGVIGTIQATEALKLILGLPQPLTGRLLTYDALLSSFREIAVRRNPTCPVCGERPTITTLTMAEQPACERPAASLLANGGPA
ncbi:MAG TPA: molybdopterin-synthase adenylyltransferase MoeB [Nitrospiria bacterium]|nr:molybdopterin-synthase adenylyltransferase MoeB [Nitrospiria bacterium]